MKYAEYLLGELAETEGFTHCFFVAGGNIMHLLDAARKRFACIPVVHEVTAGIAAEYFNEANKSGKKAFALVTAGPGLTNIVTSIAGAYLESRELLVIGGQVKTTDLRSEGIRQRGIQEVDGKSIVECITVKSETLNRPIAFSEISKSLRFSKRPGPIFLEIPLDVQAAEVAFNLSDSKTEPKSAAWSESENKFLNDLLSDLEFKSKRPIILLGGGLSRESAQKHISGLVNCQIPIMTTWNGMDRYSSEFPNYWGRPNTWGQRSSNILIQQSDLVIAIGSRLGLQQTGFAWQEFAPLAKIYQVDIDRGEITKGHPKIHKGLQYDAGEFLERFINSIPKLSFDSWIEFGQKVRRYFPTNESSNKTSVGYISPYSFVEKLSGKLKSSDVIIPCSSGGAFTVTMQAFEPKFGQIIISNKGLASMGYGLAGAIGACMTECNRTILLEGDGGFAQNLQELGTVVQNKLNLKLFIFSNEGYASIRMTQKNYFDGNYLGCDVKTGLGLPKWEFISKAYGIRYRSIDANSDLEYELNDVLTSNNSEFVEVKVDPEQTYFPKISSSVLEDGSMASNPLHLMSPDLTKQEIDLYLPFLKDRIKV